VAEPELLDEQHVDAFPRERAGRGEAVDSRADHDDIRTGHGRILPAVPQSPSEMRDAIVRNLPERTGRSLEQWIDMLHDGGPTGERKERVAWLKREHGLGHIQAGVIVDATDRPEAFARVAPDLLVDAQFAGKDAIRPLYERVRAEIELLGEDVRLEPRQTYVAFSRGRQFAAIRALAHELELGLVVPDADTTSRFRDAGSFASGRMTHRVSIVSDADIDGELLVWLRAAYDDAAG
jgi:predicted transport protein